MKDGDCAKHYESKIRPVIGRTEHRSTRAANTVLAAVEEAFLSHKAASNDAVL